MQAVLYISHGSRVEETRQEVVSCIHQAHQQVHVPLWGICYLEIASPTIEDGIEKLVEEGATEIAVIPVLLLQAGHYYSDIPQELKQVQQQYPKVTFTYGKPLGVQDRLTDVLIDRIEAVERVEGISTPDLLLVGRGSRHPETKQAIESIAQKLEERKEGSRVDVCYLAACKPSFEQGLEMAVNRNSNSLIVVPYLWFTGILIRSMHEQVNALKTNGHPVAISHYLDDHPIIVQALADRVNEVLLNKESFTVHS